MLGTPSTLEKTIGEALTGKASHVATKSLFEGLDWKTAGVQPQGAPHSVFQLLNHMSYWQDWVVKWLGGEDPPVPEHASGGWPEGVAPADEKEWEEVVGGFLKGLAALESESGKADLLTIRGEHSRIGMLQAIASHNSYHAGQVVFVRQMLEAWPPPSGGLTW